ETREISRVAGVIEAACRSADDPAGPESLVVAAEGEASREMLGRNTVDLHLADSDFLPPVEFDRFAAHAPHQLAQPQGDDEPYAAFGQGGDRGDISMIVVVMGQEGEVD